MSSWDQLLSGEWWVYMIIVILIYGSILLMNYVVMIYNGNRFLTNSLLMASTRPLLIPIMLLTLTDAKLEERIRKMAEKDADTIQAKYEASLEEAVRVRHEIQRGQPFIVVDEMDKPMMLRTLYPMRDFSLSGRSIRNSITPLNQKLYASVTSENTDHDTHRQCKRIITPIQTFKDMQIEDYVKQCLSDLLKNITD